MHYRDDYEKYRNMIYKLSRKAYARLCECGAEGAVEFEDIVSEANVSFVKACDGYKEGSGAQFITYLYNAIKFNLGRYVSDLIQDSRQEISGDRMAADIFGEEEDGDYYSLVPSDCLSPDEIVSRKQQFAANLRRLRERSSAAFDVAKNVIELSPSIEQRFASMVAEQQRQVESGERLGAPRTELGLRFIVDTVTEGMDRKGRKKVVDDIRTIYGDLLDPEVRF